MSVPIPPPATAPISPPKEGEKDRHRLSGPLSGQGYAPPYDQPRQPILPAIIVAAQPAIVVVATQTEGADAACGGNPWGGSFIDSFRYLDQLGLLAKQGVQVSIHNTLAAGSYSLLDPEDFSPKANYWAALLWHRLMGATVLDAGIPLQTGLHVYAHCQPDRVGGVALLIINNDADRTASITLPGKRFRYTLSGPDTPSMGVKLNGQLLQLEAGGRLPTIVGVAERSTVASFAPRTISFLAIPEARNPACRPH
ncbi:hypothetical protein MCEMIE4_04257 [Sphingobium cupriresistens]